MTYISQSLLLKVHVQKEARVCARVQESAVDMRAFVVYYIL